MKLELSKREIKVILELMEYGTTFLVSHEWANKPVKEDKERININDLEEKLKRAIGYKHIIDEIRPYTKPKKYITHSTDGEWIDSETLIK